SRALHAAPRGSTFISRYLIFGHDAVVQKRLRSALYTGGVERRPIHGAVGLAGSRIRQTIGVLDHLLRERPGRWLQLPAALVIILAGYGLMAAGYLATRVAPNWFRRMLPSEVVGRTGMGSGIRDTALIMVARPGDE